MSASHNDPALQTPNVYLVLTNISKHNNIRALLQTAAAFGCVEILVVGQKNFDFSPPNATINASAVAVTDSSSRVRAPDLPRPLHACVASGALPIRRFDKWNECVAHLRERSIRLVGVEIHPDARPVEHFFNPHASVAFVMGNEGTGLHEKQIQACDAFCRIPQYGGGTASLNVYVAAGIVLYRFHVYQRSMITTRSGHLDSHTFS